MLGGLPHGLTITFQLRHGVKWHDGAPFTAHDVLFTYRVTVDPKTPTAYSGDYLQVKKAEAPDDYTFRVTYPQPFAPALGSWGMAILPGHLLAGKDLTKSPLGAPRRHRPLYLQGVAGRGEDRPGKLPRLFGGAHLNRYIYRVKPDMGTMFLELKSGNIDGMGLTPLQYTRQTAYPNFISPV